MVLISGSLDSRRRVGLITFFLVSQVNPEYVKTDKQGAQYGAGADDGENINNRIFHTFHTANDMPDGQRITIERLSF